MSKTGEKNTRDEIECVLRSAFEPVFLEVDDESAQHAGHAGARPGGQSHFRVRIKARAFEGKTRLARHRMIHTALGKPLLARLHALAIEVGV